MTAQKKGVSIKSYIVLERPTDIWEPSSEKISLSLNSVAHKR